MKKLVVDLQKVIKAKGLVVKFDSNTCRPKVILEWGEVTFQGDNWVNDFTSFVENF